MGNTASTPNHSTNHSDSHEPAHFGEFEVDFRAGELRRHGIRIKLHQQPFEVLAVLLERPGEIVTREELQQKLWAADTFVDFEHGLNKAVNKLREALGDDADNPRYVETLPRRGYRFIAPVSRAARRPLVAPPQSQGSSSQILHRGGVSVTLWSVALLTITLGLLLATRYFFVPEPPRIVGSRQLTHTGNAKSWGLTCYLAMDGSRVYFTEHLSGDRWVVSQVSRDGGESQALWTSPTAPCLLGISPSLTELLLLDGSAVRRWQVPIPTGPARASPIAGNGIWATWTPDGKQFVYTDATETYFRDNELIRSNLDGSKATRLFAAPDLGWPRVSPDGRSVRWTVLSGLEYQHGDVWEATLDGRNPHPVFPEMRGQTFAGDWTKDGKLFFFFRGSGTSSSLWVRREDADLFGRSPRLLYAGPLQLSSPVSSRDSKDLYVIGADLRGELSIWDKKQQKFVPFLNGISACLPAFSPDGEWVAYVTYPDGSLWKSRVDGTQRMQLTFPPVGAYRPRWSPDGKTILFMDLTGREFHTIDTISASGGRPRQLLSGEFQPQDPDWSPDGRSIMYSGPWTKQSKIRILDIETMRSETVTGSEGLWASRWSPNGEYILAHTAEWSPKSLLYSFTKGKWIPIKGAWEEWSPDSRYLYGQEASKIVRLEVSTGKIEQVADTQDIRGSCMLLRDRLCFSVTPDGSVAVMRDTGTEEIYALQLQY